MFARLGAMGMMLSLFCAIAAAKESPTPASTAGTQKSASVSGDTNSLTPDQIAHAVKSDSVTIPTPGELFAALAKPAKPDWTGRYRGPIAINYKTRAQIALNI